MIKNALNHKKFLKIEKYKFDVLLLVLSTLFFAFFINSNLNYHQKQDIKSPLAKFKSGSAERRKAGDVIFSPLTPLTDLFNLDTLWVGPGQKATLQLLDQTTVQMSERTLLVLKRPFNGGPLTHDKLKLIKGSLEVQMPNKEVIKLDAKTSNQALPDIRKANELPSLKENFFNPPHLSTLIYRDSQESKIDFSWPSPLSGFLVLIKEKGENGDHGSVYYQPLMNSQNTQILLKPNFTYFWQLINEEKKIIYGPFKFQVQQTSIDGVKQILQKSRANSDKNSLKSKTQVIWQ